MKFSLNKVFAILTAMKEFVEFVDDFLGEVPIKEKKVILKTYVAGLINDIEELTIDFIPDKIVIGIIEHTFNLILLMTEFKKKFKGIDNKLNEFDIDIDK